MLCYRWDDIPINNKGWAFMDSKERARLRGMANQIQPVVFVGKNGVTPELAANADQALEKRELVKISVLKNCEEPASEIADTLSGRTRSSVVQVVGKKIVLYRKRKESFKNRPKN